jgi:Transmembrane secretion effector
MEANNDAIKTSLGELFRIVRNGDPLRPVRSRAADRITAKCPLCSVHFSDTGIDAGCGLESITPRSVQSRTLIYKPGAGSVAAAAFIIPWLRVGYSSKTLIVLANLLIVLVYLLMAVVRRTELVLVVAALAGVGWTPSASELWVAAQRAMPS